MPKVKSKSSVLRRFKVTSGGKIMHRSSFNRHLKRKKSPSHLRRLSQKKLVLGRIRSKLKKLLF